MKRLLFISLLLTALQGFAQHSFSKHHYFNRQRKIRLVVDKKYNQIDDSDFISYEILTGNTNSWNGDIYNLSPSLQMVCSYDNNKFFEIGVFGNIVSSSIRSNDANGTAVFASFRISKKLSATFDDYIYLGSTYFLENDLGYTSKLYQMYTCRIEYDLTNKQSYFLGYSILNDKQEIQQSLAAEFDYNFNSHITAAVGYTSETTLLQWNTADINLGVGYNTYFLKKSKLPLKIVTTLFPLSLFHNNGISPITVLLSVDF